MFKIPFLPAWLVLTALLSSLSSADDIAVYIDYSDDSGGGAENHNILFSVDTSGSMGSNVTTTYSGGNYDPNETYGDGSNSDRIFIYDTDLDYTGESFLMAQSKCASMNSLFSSDSRYPVHSGTIAQWQKTSDTVVVPGNCTMEPMGDQVQTFSGSFSWSNQQFQENVVIAPGQKFKVEIEADQKLKNIKIWSTKSNWSNTKTYCNTGNKYDYTCSNTVTKSNHTILHFRFKSKDKGTTKYKVKVTVEGNDVEVCDPDTEEERDTNDWVFDLIDTDNLNNIVECKADEGIHGISDSSTDTYVQDCPHGTLCNSPRYTSSSSSRITFLRPTQLFVPGNFHDFIQSGGDVENLSGLREEDGSRFCNSSSNRDIIFIDEDTGAVLQCKQKLEVMKIAIANILDTLEEAPINIGLQRFNRNGSGGTVIDAIDDIADNKDDFVRKLNALYASGGTPLQETLWESYLYFSGKKREQGYSPGSGAESTDPTAMNGSYYKTPITTACQTNNIIFLTDGVPQSDTGKATSIESLSGEDCNSSKSGDCLDELSGAMNRLDLTNVIEGQNSVRTYTIGFDIDLPLLVDTANKGGGQNFTANDTTGLSLAFQNIIIDILADSSTFVAPAVSVNAFNELRHRDELYFALFKPDGSPSWNGNVKKYKLDGREIVDATGAIAVDSATGFFKDTSKSIWSSDIDGSNVVLGGTANRLSSERNLYTEVNGSVEKIDLSFAADLASTSVSTTLKNTFNALTLDTNSYTPTQVLSWMLGQDVLNTNGNSSTTDPNYFIGDALHNKPVVITYGGDANDPQDVLFYMTNLGVLHAVNPSDASGTELWAYWPEEHRNNPGIYMDPGNQYIHEYGLDGEMTFVLNETDTSSSESYQLDSVKMYFGERRGGSHYYALDVSNARRTMFGADALLDNSYDKPFKVLWKITGALKADGDRTDSDPINTNITSGFSDLAQTWAKPIHTSLKHKGGDLDVLIFTGGYDPVHDNTSYSSNNLGKDESEYGNALYIVDRDTGELLLSVGNNDDKRSGTTHSEHADLLYSIPSTPTVLDVNRDGYADLIYFIDIVGNVWRVDIDDSVNYTNSDYLVSGSIAQLSDPSENRKFFNSIDISSSAALSGSNHLNLVVGSGYRAQPRHMETALNRFYVLFDDYPSMRYLDADNEDNRYNYFEYQYSDDETLYRKIEPGDLLQTTINNGANRFTKRKDASGKDSQFYISGYYFDFIAGEKLIQSSTTISNIAFFATYLPQGGSNAGVCGGGTLGSSRIYGVDLRTGTSFIENNYIESKRPGLPPDISYVIPPSTSSSTGGDDDSEEDDSILVLLGPETVNVKPPMKVGTGTKTYWREEREGEGEDD